MDWYQLPRWQRRMQGSRQRGVARAYPGSAYLLQRPAGGIYAFVARDRRSGDLWFHRHRRSQRIASQNEKGESQGGRCSCEGLCERRTTGTFNNLSSKRTKGAHLSINWVGGSHHTTARVQTGVDAGFGNGHGLLFHDLVNGNAIDI